MRLVYLTKLHIFRSLLFLIRVYKEKMQIKMRLFNSVSCKCSCKALKVIQSCGFVLYHCVKWLTWHFCLCPGLQWINKHLWVHDRSQLSISRVVNCFKSPHDCLPRHWPDKKLITEWKSEWINGLPGVFPDKLDKCACECVCVYHCCYTCNNGHHWHRGYVIPSSLCLHLISFPGESESSNWKAPCKLFHFIRGNLQWNN